MEKSQGRKAGPAYTSPFLTSHLSEYLYSLTDQKLNI
jgi:hypothetical protein